MQSHFRSSDENRLSEAQPLSVSRKTVAPCLHCAQRGLNLEVTEHLHKHLGNTSSALSASAPGLDVVDFPDAASDNFSILSTHSLRSCFPSQDENESDGESDWAVGRLKDLTARRDQIIQSKVDHRKDAQRTEAGLRQEIESLRRMLDRATPSHVRNKQKVLALQETIKHSASAISAATEEFAALTKGLESAAREEADCKAVVSSRQEAIEDEMRKVDDERMADEDILSSLEQELAVVSQRLAKVNGKRERVEEGQLGPLLQTLQHTKVETERMRAETLLMMKPLTIPPYAAPSSIRSAPISSEVSPSGVEPSGLLRPRSLLNSPRHAQEGVI